MAGPGARMIYVLNTPVLTDYGDYRFSGPITPEAARTRLAAGFTSAVGHPGAADFLSVLLGLSVPMRRISIRMAPGDEALVLHLERRLPENRVMTANEMLDIPFQLGWLARLS